MFGELRRAANPPRRQTFEKAPLARAEVAVMRGAVIERCIVALLAAWALLTIVPDLLRPFAPLGTIGLRADFDGRIVAVDPAGPAARAGVHPAADGRTADRIDFSRTPPETLFAMYGGFGGRPYVPADRRLTFALIAANGTLRTVDLRADPREPPVIERANLLLSGILGVAFIVLGTFLAWHFPRRRDVFGFFLYSIWFNPGQNYVFYAYLPRALWLPQEVLSAVVQSAGLAGFVAFALRFPTDRAEGWRRRIEFALPVLVVVLTALTLVGSGAEFGHPRRAVWLTAFWLKAAVFPLVVAAFLSKLRLLPPLERQRLRLVIFGCIPGLLLYLLAESAEATTIWQPVFERLGWSPPDILLDGAYLANALVPISIGYAVLRQRVLPIDFIVNRAVTLGILWVILGMSSEAFVLGTHRFLEENHVLSTLLIAAVLVLAAPLVEGLKHLVNELVDHVLFVRLHRARERLDAVAIALSAATSTEAVDVAIVESPCAQLGLACAALFARDDAGNYRLTAQHNWPPECASHLAATDDIFGLARRTARTPVARTIDAQRPDFPRGLEQPQLVLPIGPNGAIEAVALFSGHRDGTSLTPDEAAILVPFTVTCAAARAHVLVSALRSQLAVLRDRIERPPSAAPPAPI